MSKRCEKRQRTAQEKTQFLTVVFKLLIAADLLGPLFSKLAQGRGFCQGLKSVILAFAVQHGRDKCTISGGTRKEITISTFQFSCRYNFRALLKCLLL